MKRILSNAWSHWAGCLDGRMHYWYVTKYGLMDIRKCWKKFPDWLSRVS